MTILVEDTVLEGCDAFNDGAIVIASDTSDDGVLLTTSDVDGPSVFLAIYPEGSATAVYSVTIPKGDVISNTPVPWRLDSIGRNFRHRVAQADVVAGTLLGSRRYRMVYRIPTLNDGTLRPIFIWQVEPVEA